MRSSNPALNLKKSKNLEKTHIVDLQRPQ